jgi:uncharacterized protein (DUF2141 family)
MKIKLKFTAVIVATTLALTVPLAMAADLTVTVKDLRSTKGHLLVSVVDSEEGWNNQSKPVAAEKLVVAEKTADGKSLQVKFTLPAGKYAVQVLHDENENGKMDFNNLGIPAEGHGASNNPVVMRRPNFSETVFELKEAPTAIDVQLQ